MDRDYYRKEWEMWGGYDKNVYYNPEKAGVEIVAALDPPLSYEFDIVILVRDVKDGKLYAAHDSGCSCPTPFENVAGLHDMTPITKTSDLKPLVAQIYSGVSPGEIQDFMRKARAALKN